MKGLRLRVVLAALAVALAVCVLGGSAAREAAYVGTYTDAGSRGIYRFQFDPASGDWTAPILAGASRNPSFLALRPDARVLYAVNEVADFGGMRGGAVTAFSIDATTGSLTSMGQQPSGGADPCHLAVDAAGRHLLVANYTSGTIAVLPLDASGAVRAASAVVRHAGSGPVAARQAGPHAHQILFDPGQRFALAVDLGADRVFVYRFAPGEGSLRPNEPASAALAAGSGPRHLAWHPSGAFVYVISELRSTVTVFRYDAARGALDAVQTISTLPQGFTGTNTAAEVAVSADGRFLYVSNRGHDSLAVFAIDPHLATLTPVAHVPTAGRTPRHFAIDPSGGWLLVANQDSDSIVVFRLDRATGRPTVAGRPLSVSRPVCILFMPTSPPAP